MRYLFVLLLISTGCTTAPESSDPAAADLSAIAAETDSKRKAFKGTYLQIPKGTALLAYSQITMTTLGQAELSSSRQRGESHCVMFRRHVHAGVTRLYKFKEGTRFEVVGTENNMPLDQGEKNPIEKQGTLLVVKTTDPQKNDQLFGIGCARPGKTMPEKKIPATALKPAFRSDIFVDEELER